MKLSTLITPTTPTQDNEQNLQTSCLENILQENCLLQQFAGQSPKICKTNHPQRQYPRKIYPEYIYPEYVEFVFFAWFILAVQDSSINDLVTH